MAETNTVNDTTVSELDLSLNLRVRVKHSVDVDYTAVEEAAYVAIAELLSDPSKLEDTVSRFGDPEDSRAPTVIEASI